MNKTRNSFHRQESYVWVRTDLVEAIARNEGTVPKGWRPRKRTREDSVWGWCRAIVQEQRQQHVTGTTVPTASAGTNASSPFGHVQLRKTKSTVPIIPSEAQAITKTLLVTVTIDDPDFAPPEIDGVTVSFTYNTGDTSKVCAANDSAEETPDDLTALEQLHEPAVVYCLQRRYDLDQIYTYTGKILLALNPFRPIDSLYSEEVMAQYANSHYSASRPLPHIFAIAEDAYRSMLRSMEMVAFDGPSMRKGTTKRQQQHPQHNQSILVSGESGAGKTVTTKIIMKYLATLSSQRSEHAMSGIESQVLLSNPILESFGNARTVRNDNSSRFGKFIQIQFAPTGCLLSASIQTYLLEKVRLISQGPGERNYHVFYELLAGLSRKQRQQLLLGNLSLLDFRMTCQSRTFDRRDGVSDRDTFNDLVHALSTVGFTQGERDEIFQVVAALLHTSNLTFVGDDASRLDRSNHSLQPALELLGVNFGDLENALTRCAIQARGEILYRQLDIERAKKAVEALIKTTYGALFEHIVRRVNAFIAGEEHQGASIGVLDIFGFESFQTNSFEQLCINYCNEALQQQFNRFVFKLEQHEYQKEGIEWSFISFPDNQDVLDLIEKKHDGILSILDEQSRLPRCTDTTFARAVYEKCQNHPRLHASKAQQAVLSFSVEHYAGLVEYSTASFLEKNKDELPKETTELLLGSIHPLLASFGQVDAPDNKRSLIRDSVSTQFRSQLTDLRNRIEATAPHYVRCLKPNDELTPNYFNATVIADQLNCAGVLEAIRVSRIGFPHRYTLARFVERYHILLPKPRRKLECDQLIQGLIPQVHTLMPESNQQQVMWGMQMGKTKVFLRRRVFEVLENLRGKKLEDSAAKIQSMARMYICRLDFEIARYAAVVIQKFIRQMAAYKLLRAYRIARSILRIQCAWRCFLARRFFSSACAIAFWCQSAYRGALARQYCAYIFLDNKVSIIQRSWKLYRRRRGFRHIRSAIIAIQNRHRCRIAKKILYGLRLESRDLASIKSERDKLREESRRLRKELEDSKTQQTSHPAGPHKQEVDKLKLELDLLRMELVRAQQRNHEVLNTSNSVQRHQAEEVRKLQEELLRREEQLEYLKQEIVSLRSINDSFSLKDSFSIKSLTFDNGSKGPLSPLPVAGKSPVRADISLLDSDEPVVVNESTAELVHNMHVGQTVPYAHDDNPLSPFPEECAIDRAGPIDQHDNNELRYLHSAIRQRNRKLFDQLISQASDACVLVNQGDQHGRTAIHLAAISNDIYVAETLISLGAIVNAQDNDGETPLHLSESETMTCLLLEKGSANPNIPNVDGICALHLAVQRRDIGSVHALIRKRANINNADNIRWFTALHLIALPSMGRAESSVAGDLGPRIAQLLTGPYGMTKPDLDYQDREGNAPLHYAVQLDTEEACGIISVFLEKGANPNIVNERNQSPLHLLCHNDELRNLGVLHEILHAILFHGGDPNLQSLTGCTPLHLSLYHRDIDSAVQLVSNGAELHFLWKKPKRWNSFWKDTGSSEVLALDMLEDEHSLHRILAAINRPQKWAPTRPWCMHCHSALGTYSRALHCKHCSRLICGKCASSCLPSEYFPKSFEVAEPSWACVICEKILLGRKEDMSNTTFPTSSYADDEDDKFSC